MKNNLLFLRHIIGRLERADVNCIVFGGWAEELAGVTAARLHKDVDLLTVCDSFKNVDAFIHGQPDIEEIRAKHFPHKRAFLCDGVMTEMLLLSRKNNLLVTSFGDQFELEWPPLSTLSIKIQGRRLTVCAPHVIEYYRQHEKEIAHVRAKHTAVSGKK
jgi:hypothetical protein